MAKPLVIKSPYIADTELLYSFIMLAYREHSREKMLRHRSVEILFGDSSCNFSDIGVLSTLQLLYESVVFIGAFPASAQCELAFFGIVFDVISDTVHIV